jgi:hypothetical protein
MAGSYLTGQTVSSGCSSYSLQQWAARAYNPSQLPNFQQHFDEISECVVIVEIARTPPEIGFLQACHMLIEGGTCVW